MKKLSGTFICLIMFLFAFTSHAQVNVNNNSTGTGLNAGTFEPGKIVVKLKSGYNFNLQMIQGSQNSGGKINSGIASLNATLNASNLIKVEQPFANHKAEPLKPSQTQNNVQQKTYDLTRYYFLTFNSQADLGKIISALEKDPSVEYAEPKIVYQAFDTPNDPFFDSQFELNQIQATDAWDYTHGDYNNPQIIIGIDDSGVQWDHKDLVKNIASNLGEDADGDGQVITYNDETNQWEIDPDDINGKDDDGDGYADNFIGMNYYTDDGTEAYNPMASLNNFHGTHVAGIAAGATDNAEGISSIGWNVKFIPVKHGSNDGGSSLYNMEQGLVFLADMGVDIINCSWGTPVRSKFMQDMIDYCHDKKVLVVASAGNANNEYLSYPSAYKHVISVASVSSEDKKASYSTYGIAPDISAPGGDIDIDGGILSTMPGNNYGRLQGTSMAAPLVSGLCALIKSRHTDWTVDDIANHLLSTADKIGGANPGMENSLGTGRINAWRAMDWDLTNLDAPLRLMVDKYSVNDENGNGVIEPGEKLTFNFTIRNFNQFNGYEGATFTLESNTPDATVDDAQFTGDILADDYSSFDAVTSVTISPDVKSSEVITLNLKIETPGKEISWGENNAITIVVTNGGVLVYGPQTGDGSSYFVAGMLSKHQVPFIFSPVMPQSLVGFDAVFACKGNHGTNGSPSTFWTEEEVGAISEYLENGGKLYLEGGNLGDESVLPSLFNMANLMGISGFNAETKSPIEILNGLEGSIMNGIQIKGSAQTGYDDIVDQIVVNPDAGGVAAVEEPGYGVVGVQADGNFKQKSFYLSYGLGNLNDGGFPNTKEEMFVRILKFFGYKPGLNLTYVKYTTNDENNNKVVEPGEKASFNFSFLNTPDGTASYGAHFTLESDDPDVTILTPDYTGDIAGIVFVNLSDMFQIQISKNAKSHIAHFTMKVSADDVTLNGDTEVNFDLIITNGGVLVYEPMSGRDLSGTFINGVLSNQGLNVVYTNVLPPSIDGFDAAFISKGNFGTSNDQSAYWTAEELQIISEYLADGGHCYVEGGAIDDPSLESAFNVMNGLLGIDGYNNETKDPIVSLKGEVGSAVYKLAFNGSNQIGYEQINDQLVPKADEGGLVAITEPDFGAVGIQNEGTMGQKGFYFSYALSELNDDVYPNTREEMLLRISKFFGLNTYAKIALNSYSANDNSGNGAIEAGEDVSFNFEIKNITNQTSYQNALFTIETSNPDITITEPTFSGDITATDFVSFNGVTNISINQNAQSQIADLKLKVTLPDNNNMLLGEFNFKIYIANGGVIVYEPATGNNLSGSFINKFFTRQNIHTVYTNELPPSLLGFDAAYISMGNPGENNAASANWTSTGIATVTDYLMNGGKCYVEGGVMNDPNLSTEYDQMMNLLGISGMTTEDQEGFTAITGQGGSIINEIMFNGTTQTDFMGINDNLAVNKAEGGVAAFNETNYGVVAVQNEGTAGQKGFYFSYAVSELTDTQFPNTQEEMMVRIARFFGLNALRNANPDFSVDFNSGNAPATVNFTDMSTGDTYITGWAWDINNDGTIESTDQKFAYTFDTPGSYDVKLTITDGIQTWSIVKTDLIHIFEGQTAYEGNSPQSTAVVASLQDMDLQGAFSFETWINPVGAGEILNKGAVSFVLMNNGALELNLTNDDATVSQFMTAANAVVTNKWQHVAFTYSSANGVHIYVNGKAQTATSANPLTSALEENDGAEFFIGNNATTDNAFKGLIDETRLWSVERSAQDIKFGKNDPRLVDANNLVAYWKYNSGRGPIVSDKTGNGNDLTISADFGLGYLIQMELNLSDKNPCNNSAIELGSYWVDKKGMTRYNTVVGGSDNYDYNWHPNTNIINPKSASPILPNATSTQPFTLIAVDKVTGQKLTGTFNVTVKNKPQVHIPVLLMVPRNTPVDLMVQISDFNPAYKYQWQDDHGNVIDNPTNVFPATGLTKYYVTAWNENGCPSTTVRLTTYVAPRKEMAGDVAIGNNGSIALATYPNPVTDNLNVLASFDSQSTATVRLLDITGREVYSNAFAGSNELSEAINVSNLTSGTYTLVITTDNDVVTQNIVIVR